MANVITTRQFHIPEELLVLVLVRLPPKSLLRFKVVSKTWHALISSSYFISCHIDFSKTTNATTVMDEAAGFQYLINFRYPYRVGVSPYEHVEAAVIPRSTKEVQVLECACASTLFIGVHGVVIPPHHERPGQFVKNEHGELVPSSNYHGALEWSVQGPVNGVYCIKITAHFSCCCTILLWNPGNRQGHVLPPIPSTFPHDKVLEYRRHMICGFGYDSLADDYKLLLIIAYGDHYDSKRCYYFFEYGLATNTWKQLDPLDIGDVSLFQETPCYDDLSNRFSIDDVLSRNNDGTYFKEAFHWVLNFPVLKDQMGLLSYDFGSSTFRVTLFPIEIMKPIVIPDEDEEEDHYERRFDPFEWLAVVDGCLAIVQRSTGIDGLVCSVIVTYDEYVIKEYGMADSLTRAYTITITSPRSFNFLGIVDNELFVQIYGKDHEDDDRLVSYPLNSSNSSEEYREHCCLDRGLAGIRVLPYRGSLVPVKPRDKSTAVVSGCDYIDVYKYVGCDIYCDRN